MTRRGYHSDCMYHTHVLRPKRIILALITLINLMVSVDRKQTLKHTFICWSSHGYCSVVPLVQQIPTSPYNQASVPRSLPLGHKTTSDPHQHIMRHVPHPKAACSVVCLLSVLYVHRNRMLIRDGTYKQCVYVNVGLQFRLS